MTIEPFAGVVFLALGVKSIVECRRGGNRWAIVTCVAAVLWIAWAIARTWKWI